MEIRLEDDANLTGRFLTFLADRGRLTETSAERIRRVQLETIDRLAAVLLKLGVLSEMDLAAEMAAFSGFPAAEPGALVVASTDELGISDAFLRAHQIVPSRVTDACIDAACWDALDEYASKALAFACQRPVTWAIATRSQIQQALDAGAPRPDRAGRAGAVLAFEDDEIERLKDLASEAPVVRLVQRTIDDAVLMKASDIHLEPSDAALLVRYRLDGLLHEIQRHAKDLSAPVISRIKVMAGLNIAERRLPQDGRIRVTVQGREIDLRVATSPTLHGESLVMRILDRQDVALDFEALGFDDRLRGTVLDAISRPHGIVLVTGPTGSGKTTTLYAALQEINTPDKKILTVEDPVEYVLQGVNQLPLRPQIGLTFANALRSFLRQDPDVMMVGEIRDRETAEIAIQAALTGHLLLSTLHTNTAAAAIARLLDMGIDDYLLTSTLHLIVGQRLVRRLCSACRQPYEPAADVLQRFGLAQERVTWFRAVGCSACLSGYRGRTTIIEALPMSDSVRAKVLERSDAHQIEQVAINEGMRTMFRHGFERVCSGMTTIDEVLRVTNLS